ncbi:hypothetical protein PMIN01_13260 [Paraphaeosphaeria minitans]|uniref:Uncharacterized protein n=1 Tax=Paraphaeosphaeria minitans TaxID=565426 RepID=A0A9P6G5L7_9PLEO|nr:hypothetical protein PMIN01_13260 [Paraphaeosphaeria minitans]
MNFTISVPPGTTNHGDPRLICQPPQWSDYVIFYFGNYLAHAATVRSPPGETWKGVAWSAATALFLPFTGLFQGVQHLLHFPASKSREQALRKAAASGAICTVVKMRKRNPKSDDSQDAESQATVPDGQEPDWWPGRRTPRLSRWRKIQGITITPPGYEIVVVPKIFPLKLRCDKPDDISEEDWKKVVADLDLPCNYNVPKALISLVQAFWGIVTIYEARGNQIDMYGYAAFGLTVVPYAVMSITNLLAGLVRPEYPCMFLASSPDLVEASRCNGRFDCIVADINTNSAIVRKYNFRPPSYPLNPRNAIRIASRSLKAFHKSLKSRLREYVYSTGMDSGLAARKLCFALLPPVHEAEFHKKSTAARSLY